MKSNLYGGLSLGCKLCLKGGKLPIYTSFLCNKSCYYCPIIPTVNKKNIIMVATKKINSIDEIKRYAKKSPGMSISGGEPLLMLDRTLSIIKLAKKECGDKFHIHMYTNGELITNEIMEKLVEAGLDEIRIHNFNLDIFKRAIEFDIDVGAEIPCAPNEEEKFVNFIHSLDKLGIKFVNIDEMQSSKLALPKLKKKGFKLKGNRVVGSEETGLNIVRRIRQDKLNISVHYCSIRQEINNAKKRLKLIGI
jgi:hypothetical protein